MTKARTLEQLKHNIEHAAVLDLEIFSFGDYSKNPKQTLNAVLTSLSQFERFVVRSSCSMEDQSQHSCAGLYESVLNVDKKHLNDAVQKVFNSYGKQLAPQEEILIQPMLDGVCMSGVLFTNCPKSGAPYYIVNYNETGDTTAVTSGKAACSTCYIYHGAETVQSQYFRRLIKLAKELTKKLDNASLDIEFAFTEDGELTLLQVRPLNSQVALTSAEVIKKPLLNIKEKFASLSVRHPYLYGNRSILGVMPDWNPAEIIGIQPKPLALSLYKELITDGTWAYQRDNYGYRNLRSFPLLIDLCGLTYIDIRVSFNSFLPKNLPEDLAEKLVNYYLDELESQPHLHDKVEFDIVFSCYTFDIDERLKVLQKQCFSEDEVQVLCSALRKLTNTIIKEKHGLWLKDSKKIKQLENRHQTIFYNKEFDPITKIYWLIQDCKRYGTLPFAGLARAGFIAVQLLQSMVNIGVLSEEDKLSFLNSLDSVSTNLASDFNNLDQEHFLQKYGYLRPGTYDILSKRYDEDPETYFDWNKRAKKRAESHKEFKLSLTQMKEIEALLIKHRLEHDVVGLFSFMKSAIEGREYAKFVFTRTLSDILSLLKQYGEKHDIGITEPAYLDIKDLIKTVSSSYDVLEDLTSSIKRGKEKFDITKHITLSPLILSEGEIDNFILPDISPNFITNNKVTAPVMSNISEGDQLKGKVVFIPSADPGYDWLFTREIAGFITAYGGVNSHMSIRAAELNIPAVIGAGKVLYEEWSQADKITIDCEQQHGKVVARNM